MSRSSKFRLCALFASLCTALSGPALSEEPSYDPNAVVTVAVASGFTTLDPCDASDRLSRMVVKSFYEGLFRLTPDMKVVPQLATGYEVSEDGMLYTIRLREGVKFHDGSPLTAADVAASLNRIIDPKSGLGRAADLLKKID